MDKTRVENAERISVKLQPGEKEFIRKHAAAIGESLNGFMRRAAFETLERDCES